MGKSKHVAPQPAGNTTTADTLLILSPPTRLMAWLEKVFDAKRQKGDDVPPEFDRWLTRWQKIRTGMVTEIDILTDDEWQAIGVVLERILPDDQR